MQDDLIERVLKAAGRREAPPADVEHAVRENLRRAWRAAVADERARRRRRASVAIAAGVAVAAIAMSFFLPRIAVPPQSIATVVVASEDMRVKAGRLGSWQAIAAGQHIAAGQVVATGAAGRAGLALPGGVSVRLDRHTRVAVAAADRFVIEGGAIYVDAGPGAGAAAQLEIETPAGVVRHLGTQYEVRLHDATVTLRVREGRVQWQSNSGHVVDGRSGEQLVIDDRGTIDRSRILTYGEPWDWAAAAAPAIDINGLALADFLAWAGRELGCEVEFGSPHAAAQAAAIRLHGSIAGLTPAQALDAVLGTTKLSSMTAAGRITISESAASGSG